MNLPTLSLQSLLLPMLLLTFGYGKTLDNPSEVKQYQVFVFVAEECPISIAMASPLNEVAEQYAPIAEFKAVFPNQKSDEISIRAFLGRYELERYVPILDKDQALARKLGATITPEVVVTDQDGKVHYRGRITDAYAAPGRVRHGKSKNQLEEVLSTLSSGGSVRRPWSPAVGCFITFLKAAQ